MLSLWLLGLAAVNLHSSSTGSHGWDDAGLEGFSPGGAQLGWKYRIRMHCYGALDRELAPPPIARGTFRFPMGTAVRQRSGSPTTCAGGSQTSVGLEVVTVGSLPAWPLGHLATNDQRLGASGRDREARSSACRGQHARAAV